MKYNFVLIYIICFIFSLVLSNEHVPTFNIDLFNEESYLPLKNNQKFIVELEGNPTTGFQWYLENDFSETKIVVPLNLKENKTGDYFSQPQDGTTVKLGAGGLYHFKFQTHESGKGSDKLRFVYKRHWDDEGQIRKSISIVVINSSKTEDL
jgi:predicted secreted protein